MHLIYPLIFIAVSLFHVHCCYLERLKSRYISKLFLMPLLLLWYLDVISQQTELINKRSSIIINGNSIWFSRRRFINHSEQKVLLNELVQFLMGHFLYIYAII